VTPLLTEIAEDLGRVNEVGRDAIPGLLTHLAAIQTALAARLAQFAEESHSKGKEGGRLLTVEDVAQKLGVAPDWLYRRAVRLPFTVRLGRALRFSEEGLDRWIRARNGR